LCRPGSRRMFGHVEMNDLPATVKKDDEAVQNAEIDRRDSEKIYGRNLLCMIGKECLPSLRRRLFTFHSILRHGRFRQIVFSIWTGRIPSVALHQSIRLARRPTRLPAWKLSQWWPEIESG